jgi:hypothetical protein
MVLRIIARKYSWLRFRPLSAESIHERPEAARAQVVVPPSAAAAPELEDRPVAMAPLAGVAIGVRGLHDACLRLPSQGSS